MAPQLSRPDASPGKMFSDEQSIAQPFGRRWNDIVPQPVDAGTPAPEPRGARRLLTRESGRALEMLGHAVDYLEDSYIEDGLENEIVLVASAPTLQAVRMLADARREVLASIPLVQPASRRLWNAIFHRNTRRAEDAAAARDAAYARRIATPTEAQNMVR